MVDGSMWVGRRTSDAIQGDLSDGRADSDAFGIRHGQLEYFGLVPTLRCVPGHVLCMAQAAREQRGGVVYGSFARSIALSASDGDGAVGSDYFVAPSLPAFGAAQAAGNARASGSRDLLAGGFDDRRYSQTCRADHAGQAAPAGARSAAARDDGRGGQ